MKTNSKPQKQNTKTKMNEQAQATTEGQAQSTSFADPLDTNVSDVNISRPIVPPGLYDLTIKEAKKDTTKAGGDCIKFQLATTADCMDVTGKENVPAGHILFHQITVTPTGKLTVDMIKRSVATIAQCAGVGGTVRNLIDTPQAFYGRTVRVKVGVSKETSEFPARNEIKDFVKV